MRRYLAAEKVAVEEGEEYLQLADVGQHSFEALDAATRTSRLVTGGPGRGLPPRTYLPILALTALAFLGIVGYFLKIGLATTGAALGPEAQAVAPAHAVPGDVTVPQRGGGPPAPVRRLLGDLRERIVRNPSDLAALVELARLYVVAAKYPQAIAYYKRALALDPANPATRSAYAAALHGQGDDLRALRELESVLAKRPNFPEALFTVGVVAMALGRRSEAADAFKGFLKVKPGDSRAGDARKALRNLGA